VLFGRAFVIRCVVVPHAGESSRAAGRNRAAVRLRGRPPEAGNERSLREQARRARRWDTYDTSAAHCAAPNRTEPHGQGYLERKSHC
jgi:hypothetical protein